MTQSRENVFVHQAGLVSLVPSPAQMVTMATTAPRSVLVKMAPRVITCRGRAYVHLGGLVTIVHINVIKDLSVTDVIHDADVTMVTEAHVML